MGTDEICKKFISDKILDINPLGNGHINDTFLVKTMARDYVIQKVPKDINISHLEYNINLYSEVMDKCGLLYPKWIRNKDGNFYQLDENDGAWRMYPYIECDAISQPLSKAMLYSLGQGLAKLHSAFREITKDPIPVYPHLHDLRFYYQKYKRLLGEDGRALQERMMVEQIESLSDGFLSADERRQSIIHADTKLTNVLFKDGQVIGFIDFDTIMPGPATFDIADAIRSCCVQNGKVDKEAKDSLVEGYLSLTDAGEAQELTDHLQQDYNRLCFELALRYYIDVISGENYFKDKDRTYKLERVRTLLDGIT